jgi:hypothetical protein
MTAVVHDEVPAGVIRVPDGQEVLEFSGHQVAEASTRVPGKPRWTDLRLYALDDGTGRYVLARVGKSLVYHRIPGCSRGVRAPATELLPDSEPCQYCRPPAVKILASMPGAVVSAETDHNGAEVCAAAADAVERLKLPPEMQAASGIGTAYSEPALRLLDEARQHDPAIEAVLSRVRRL